MLGIEVVEVHVRAPLRKREPDGLSAKDAYKANALDGRNVGAVRSIGKERGHFAIKICGVISKNK
jgi:hypothetical protein